MENTMQTEITAVQPERKAAPTKKKRIIKRALAVLAGAAVVWGGLLRVKHSGTKDFNGYRRQEARGIYEVLCQYADPTLDYITQEIPHGNYFACGSLKDNVMTFTPDDPDMKPVEFTLADEIVSAFKLQDKKLYFCFRMNDDNPLYVNCSLRKGVWNEPIPRTYKDIKESRTMAEFYLKTCIMTYTEASQKELAPYLDENDPIRQLYCGG